MIFFRVSLRRAGRGIWPIARATHCHYAGTGIDGWLKQTSHTGARNRATFRGVTRPAVAIEIIRNPVDTSVAGA